MKVHPDRNPNDKEANSKFQKLGKIYETLSDPDKRGYYDETGKILDDNAEDFLHQERDWDEYWRILFKVEFFLKFFNIIYHLFLKNLSSTFRKLVKKTLILFQNVIKVLKKKKQKC